MPANYGLGDADQPAQAAQPSGWSFDWLQPQGAELRDKAMAFGGISPEQINKQAALAGEQQRQQNISGYNAAVASQRGVNPNLAVNAMGNALTGVNAQTSANTQNIQAQNTFGAAQSNQGEALDYYKALLGAQAANRGANATEYAARESGSAQRNTAEKGLIGDVLGSIGDVFSDIGQKEPIEPTGSEASDRKSKNPGLLSMYLMSDEDQKEALHEHIFRKHMFEDDGQYAGHEGQAKAKYQQEEMAERGPHAARKFMDTLKPQEYEYKPEGHADDGKKPHVGVMAQDLEKSPYGKSVVQDTPEGKMVDTRQLSMMLGAAVGDLHHRLSTLEKRYG